MQPNGRVLIESVAKVLDTAIVSKGGTTRGIQERSKGEDFMSSPEALQELKEMKTLLGKTVSGRIKEQCSCGTNSAVTEVERRLQGLEERFQALTTERDTLKGRVEEMEKDKKDEEAKKRRKSMIQEMAQARELTISEAKMERLVRLSDDDVKAEIEELAALMPAGGGLSDGRLQERAMKPFRPAEQNQPEAPDHWQQIPVMGK
jgi:hypothetical protein